MLSCWKNNKIMLMNALSSTEIQQDSRSANLLEASFIKFEISSLEDIGYSSNEITKICLLSIWLIFSRTVGRVKRLFNNMFLE